MTLQQLKELVLDLDIPHPTIPEYVELHEKMQKILKAIYELERGENMLQTIRDFKQRIAIAMIHEREDAELNMEVNSWLIRNKLQILDILDDALTKEAIDD